MPIHSWSKSRVGEWLLADIHLDELDIEPMEVWNMRNEIHEVRQLLLLALIIYVLPESLP